MVELAFLLTKEMNWKKSELKPQKIKFERELILRLFLKKILTNHRHLYKELN